MGYKFFFFDADDTLFDTQSTAEKCFLDALRAANVTLDENPHVFKSFVSVSRRLWSSYEEGIIEKEEIPIKRFEQIFVLHDLDGDAELASTHFLNSFRTNIILIENAKDVVKALKDIGKNVGIITNGFGQVQVPRLENSDLHGHIDYIVTAEEGLAPKPHVSMYQRAFELAGAKDKEEVLVIGDSLFSDILGAKNFGVDSCWFNPGNMKNETDLNPKFEISSLGEILTLMK